MALAVGYVRLAAPLGVSSHSGGKNSRESSGQEAWSVTACPLTPTWQLATLPSAPQCCGATPTEWRPNFGNAVSSITHAAGAMAAVMRWASRRRTGVGSQGDCVDELLQRLLDGVGVGLRVAAGQPGGHRLDRLALAVQ